MNLARRTFLGSLGAVTAGLALGENPTPTTVPTPAPPLVDFHVHLFGAGDGGTGCYLSPQQRNHWNYPFFRRLLNLTDGQMDQDYVRELVRQQRGSSIQKAVLLAQDARYDEQGRLDLAATNFYVPNDYLFQVVAEHPGLFLPCISINPKRRDAVEELERCASMGARVLKVHPPTQDVDPGEDRFRPFYRRVAARGILLMVHTGSEHSSSITSEDFNDPVRLLPALEEGCTVIGAHSGMGSFLDDRPFRDDFFLNLLQLIRRFRNLYCETAVLGSMFRWRTLPRILREPEVVSRLIHASDWPFTSNALVSWNRLSFAQLLQLCAEKNLMERDFQLKRALGLPAEVFERGAQLLGLREPSQALAASHTRAFKPALPDTAS